MTRYSLSEDARRDLVEIAGYIANDRPQVAYKIIDRLEGVFELLAANPEIARRRDDLTSMPIRIFPVSGFLVVYLADDVPIGIVGVISGSGRRAAYLKW